jgi:hypothetical protein
MNMGRINVKRLSAHLVFASLFPGMAAAATSSIPASSAFLAPVGQTTHYRYFESIATAKGSNRETAFVTLTTRANDEVSVEIAVDGKVTRSLDFYRDPSGALRAVPHAGSETGKQDDTEGLPQRLSIAAQIGAHPGGDITVPVTVTIPWASRPVLQPTLLIDMTKANSFTANASDETSVNPPQQNKHSLLPFTFGLGILGGAVGGTPGRIVGTGSTVLLAVIAQRRGRPAPSPLQVSVHLTGQLTDGRLRTLSGEQEETINSQRQTHSVLRDQWSLAAE